MSNWETARHAAWQKFGIRYWKWFVFGPFVAKAIGITTLVTALALTGLWVAQNVEGWLAWLSWVSNNYLLPMVLVGVGVSLYALVAVIFWRLNGWKWKLNGFTTGRYSMIVMSLLVVSMTLVGVVTG